VELVDSAGHNFGPDSDEVKSELKQVDAELVRVLDAVSEADNVNVMVFSDHGMSARLGGARDAASGLINVLDYVRSEDWAHAAGSRSAPALQIWPKADNEDSVSSLKT